MPTVESIDARWLVALLALFVAIWQIFSSRRHNKLSVRPYIYDSLERDSANLTCGISVHNKGLGPAIITSSKYFLDGKPVDFHELIHTIEKLPIEFSILIHDLNPGCAIAKDERHSLMNIRWDEKKFETPKSIQDKKKASAGIAEYGRQISKRVGFEITYQSSYGEPDRLESHPRSYRRDNPF